MQPYSKDRKNPGSGGGFLFFGPFNRHKRSENPQKFALFRRSVDQIGDADIYNVVINGSELNVVLTGVRVVCLSVPSATNMQGARHLKRYRNRTPDYWTVFGPSKLVA